MYNPFRKLIDYLRYQKAVSRADEAHAKTGERYYVMPSSSGKLIIMDRRNFRGLKMKHYISHRAGIRDLVSESFYFTPYRNGNGYLDGQGRQIKLRLYYSWCKAIRKQKKGGH